MDRPPLEELLRLEGAMLVDAGRRYGALIQRKAKATAKVICLDESLLPDCDACEGPSKYVTARTMDLEGPGIPGVIYGCGNRPCKRRKDTAGAYLLRKEIGYGT